MVLIPYIWQQYFEIATTVYSFSPPQPDIAVRLKLYHAQYNKKKVMAAAINILINTVTIILATAEQWCSSYAHLLWHMYSKLQ